MNTKHLSIILLILGLTAVCSARAETTSASCAECHNGNQKAAPTVTAEMIDRSVHEGTHCLECHTDIAENGHNERSQLVNCGDCHEDETAVYQKHGVYEVGANSDIPTCADCHGTHGILPSSNKNSRVHARNLPDTCSNCHENPEFAQNHSLLPQQPVQSYRFSVHGMANQRGENKAATCGDCHHSRGSAHQIYSAGSPESTINHFAIPKTCGQCHIKIEKDYWAGIHGQLTSRGRPTAPVCTSCHGEHRIYRADDHQSSVNSAQLPESTCTPCHESANLTEKLELTNGQMASFIDIYHGNKSGVGDSSVANCASCHGAHLILPDENAASSIYPENLQETCGNCHTGISQELAETRIHSANGQPTRGWPQLFSNIYKILIALMVTGMILYILLDLSRHLRIKLRTEQKPRMSKVGIIQHMALVVSFFLLVISGFALRFSDAWWAVLLFGREGGFPLRSMIHRGSAILFVTTALSHLFYLPSFRGRAFMEEMLPRLTDFGQLIQMLKFNFGASNTNPSFGRYSYVEKFEYWALVWGGLIMTVTGIMLWFDNYFIQFFPKVTLDVMQVIHYYEAWLATLAILIWHLYATVFNPTVYPMNPAWITGKMPKDQYLIEHAGEEVKLKSIPN